MSARYDRAITVFSPDGHLFQVWIPDAHAQPAPQAILGGAPCNFPPPIAHCAGISCLARQVEYALEAVRKGTTAVAVKGENFFRQLSPQRVAHREATRHQNPRHRHTLLSARCKYRPPAVFGALCSRSPLIIPGNLPGDGVIVLGVEKKSTAKLQVGSQGRGAAVTCPPPASS